MTVMISCFNCGEWNQWSNPEGKSFFLDKTKRNCSNCGHNWWNWRSIVSLRTFNPKRKTTKLGGGR